VTPIKRDRKPAEPSSFTLTNMSRVTPLQLPLISYPAGRYQPIRPIGDPSASGNSPAPKKSSGPAAAFGGAAGIERVGAKVSSGSIIMLRESEGGGDVEYAELDRSLWPPEAEVQTVGEPEQVVGAATAEVIEEAEVPAPFEYPFED